MLYLRLDNFTRYFTKIS